MHYTVKYSMIREQFNNEILNTISFQTIKNPSSEENLAGILKQYHEKRSCFLKNPM